MPMQLKQTVNVFIVMNPTTFYIPLLNVKRLSPSLIKLFSSWFNKTNNSKYLPTVAEKLFGMLHNGNDKNYLNSTVTYSSPNTSYIVKN